MEKYSQSLIDSIKIIYPKLMEDVTNFSQELQKINLLSDERWLFVLSNLEMEFERRIKQLDLERQKISPTHSHLGDTEIDAILIQKRGILLDMVSIY